MLPASSPLLAATHVAQTCDVRAKVDCGIVGIDQQQCTAKGCCWLPVPSGSADPWCFFKGDAPSTTCFGLLPASFDDPPFDEHAIGRMAKYFLANLDVNSTGAVIASPGAVPALPDDCPGGYRFHWMRDGALSIQALMDTSNITGYGMGAIRPVVERYVAWVRDVTAGSDEPKWNISAAAPYAFGWCRPQTDGPPLRALSLLAAMDRFATVDAWALARADLDWVADGDHSVTRSCDLWEEGTDEPNLLWNRVVMRAALLRGAAAAAARGDAAAQAKYERAAKNKVADPWADHVLPGGTLSECPAIGQSQACADQGKSLDGVVILALVHAGAAATAVADPASAAIARTVGAYNAAFCKAYPINREGQPGILYGRYLRDKYGGDGGNPWVLITAALANLLYRAATSAAARSPSAEAADAWRATFGASFGEATGSFPAAFVAAGDSVLRRLRSHVAPTDEDHLFEQIDKRKGSQYNAKDLTWSYAEMLGALAQRRVALAVI